MATFLISYGTSCVILEFDSPCSPLQKIDQDVLFGFPKILFMTH